MGIFILYYYIFEGFYLTLSYDATLSFKGDMDFRFLNSVVTGKDNGKFSS